MSPDIQINPKEISHTLVVKYGLKSVLNFYINKVDTSLKTADVMAKGNNSIGSAAALGQALEASAILKTIMSDEDTDVHMFELSEKVKKSKQK